MKRLGMIAIASVVALASITARADQQTDKHERATAALKKLGAEVTVGKESTAVRITKSWKGGDAALVHLKNLKNLTHLLIKRAPITNKAFVHLEPLTDLEMLWLTSSNVTDESLAHLKPLLRLERLGLYGNPITVDGMKHLVGLSKLSYVVITGTKMNNSNDRKELQRLFPDVTDW